MKYKFIFTAILLSISNINISNAADIIYQSPQEPIYDENSLWEGAYIGAQLGYDWTRTKLTNQDYSAKEKGIIGGLYAGYNWEFSNAYLFGIEGDINYTKISSDNLIYVNNRSANWNSRIQWEGAVRARLGVNYERLLPYIAGGVAFASVKDSLSDLNITEDFKKTRVGYTIGAGLDYAVINNIILRAEYRYSDYGRKDFTGYGTDNKITTNSLRLGIAYKF